MEAYCQVGGKQKKKNKYDAVARAQHCTFFPFAVETLGTFGEGAVKFLETLAKHHTEYVKDGLTYSQFLAHAASSIAVAVQRRNPACLLKTQSTRRNEDD